MRIIEIKDDFHHIVIQLTNEEYEQFYTYLFDNYNTINATISYYEEFKTLKKRRLL